MTRGVTSLLVGVCIYLPCYEAFSRHVGNANGLPPQHLPFATSPKRVFSDGKTTELESEESQAFLDAEKLLSGRSCFQKGLDFNLTHAPPVRQQDLVPNAPHLTFQKFLSMQKKRVVVSFRFSDVPWLSPYFLTVASKLKKLHPDIIIEKRSLSLVDANSQIVFEVLVDGKVVMAGGSNTGESSIGGRVDVQNTQSVFVSMDQISAAVVKARKRRRPTTLYGQDDDTDDGPDSLTTKRWQRSPAIRNGTKRTAN